MCKGDDAMNDADLLMQRLQPVKSSSMSPSCVKYLKGSVQQGYRVKSLRDIPQSSTM